VKSRYKNICLSYGLVVLTSVPEEYIPKKKVTPEDVLLYAAETMYFLTPDLGL
jgi:hypothetical protein